MKKLLDKLILLCCCIMILTTVSVSWLNILVLLTAVIISALGSYFANRVTIVLTVIYIAACIFMPECFIFLPLIAYDCSGFEKYPLKLLPVLPVLTWIYRTDIWLVGMICLFIVIAFVLQMRTEEGIQNQSEYYNLQDSAREQSLSLEKKNRELMEKQDYEVRLATLRERNRISREIHDNVGHLLTRSILQVSAMSVVNKENPETRKAISDLKGTLTHAMDNIRTSVHNLHDESIDLKMQIYSMTEEFSFCKVKFKYEAEEIPGDLRYCFLAVVKEALSNIARHSNATEASITVIEHPALYQLIVHDNGIAGRRGDSAGIGLKNMAERVEAFNGTFYVDRSKGFKIFISIPRKERNKVQ